MTSFRRNPAFFGDDGDDSENPLFAALPEPDVDATLRRLQGKEDEGRQSEQRVEAARSRGGTSPRVLELAEAGLRGSLSDAQKLYAELGAKLEVPTLGRQERRDTRDARRVLEEAWGVNALRSEARPGKQQRFKSPDILAKTVRMPLDGLPGVEAGGTLSVSEPLDEREPMVTLQAVASFGRKYVPMGRGRMGQRTELKGVYYGVDAQDKADRDYAQMLIDEGLKLEARLADMESNDSRRERVTRLLEENKRQKTKLVERRLANAEALKKLLG